METSHQTTVGAPLSKSPRLRKRKNPWSRKERDRANAQRKHLAALEDRAGHANKATALRTCGESGVMLTPDGNVSLNANGQPVRSTITCKNASCPDCSRIWSRDKRAEYEPLTAKLLADASISDGRLRMMTLTKPDPIDGSWGLEEASLWRGFKKLRKVFPSLKHCFAVRETTANAERRSFHPHLHVMVVGDWIDRDAVLAEWQRILGVEVGGAFGGVDIRQIDGVAEALKYAMKGGADSLMAMPDRMAVQYLAQSHGRQRIRKYGAFRNAIDDDAEVDAEPEMNPIVDDDATVYDAVTGEAFQAGHCSWSWHDAAKELARAIIETQWAERERDIR